jgi:2'-5' RNA ligase
MAPARCFLAVPPPAELIEVLGRIDRPARSGLRWTPPEQWHVTLAFFASVEPAELTSVLDRAGPGLPAPIMARAGPRPSVLGGRVWMVPVAGLDGLAGAVAAVTGDLTGAAGPIGGGGRGGATGLGGSIEASGAIGAGGAIEAGGDGGAGGAGGERPFRGHLTLARARHPEALRGLAPPPIHVEWTVSEVVAFRSELGPTGARHHPQGRWLLGPR